ncbi:MAG: sarcosine oxidase [Cryobacterium sp.]|nr:sarcosine oxidase [Cryobacterium sp.]
MVVFDADVAVVGLGAMGSAAAWRLAERGVDVLGIERFHPGHVQGSSHGQTRLFRVACLEHPNLVTLARRSRELWEELQARTSTPIIRITGGIMMGPAESDVIRGTLAAAAAHDLPVTHLNRDELVSRFPQHENLLEGTVGVWDPEAGVLHPEAGVIAAVAAAREAGAQIFTDTRVGDIQLVEGGVRIQTPARVFMVRQVVMAAGAWLGKFLPELPLDPWRTPMTWFETDASTTHSFTLEDFPVFIRAVTPDNWIWGHGSADGFGVKVGPDRDPNFVSVDPDSIDRGISPHDHELVSMLVSHAIPGLHPEPAKITTCMVTQTPDGQFLIGRPGGDPRLVVAGGCSGHAFKHATGIGELVAQIVTGDDTLIDTAFVDPNRFLREEKSLAS